MKPLLLFILLLTGCESLPSNPEWWMEREINACLPTAITFKESLNKYNVWAEVLRYSWKDRISGKVKGHAVVAYLYPKGQNQLWTYDSAGSYRTRAFTNNVQSIAQYSHTIRGNTEKTFSAEYIK